MFLQSPGRYQELGYEDEVAVGVDQHYTFVVSSGVLDTSIWSTPGKVVRHSLLSSDAEEEEELDDMSEIRAAVDHILTVFQGPLQVKIMCLSSFRDELEEAS